MLNLIKTVNTLDEIIAAVNGSSKIIMTSRNMRGQRKQEAQRVRESPSPPSSSAQGDVSVADNELISRITN